jgi:diguanylate cyclase
VARVGADSFAGILTDFHGATDIAHLIEQHVQGAYAAPFTIEGQDIGIAFTIGIALYPSDAQAGDDLYHKAEAALSEAKLAGDRYRFYAPEMSAHIAESLFLESRLRQAIENEEFVLHYQPKVDVATRRVQGLEALLRWQDPERGLIMPGAFIPVLEDTGMIVEVGFWAMCRALEDERRWRNQGARPPRIAVNVSALQLQQPNFVDRVRQAVRAFGGGDSLIDLELTESIIMNNIETSVEMLGALRDMGISIAIDDFGTGYSSLSYLARLPVTALKIDRSFVSTMTERPESVSIVSTTISLAHSLDMQVIAEGVEIEEQARLLRLLRCDQMQGYLISRPRTAEDLAEFLH